MMWKCFHCDEEFSDEVSAGAHFGPDPTSIPGCVMKLTGGDLGLLVRIRELEATVRELRADIECESTSTSTFCARLESQLRSYRPFRDCRSVQDAFNAFDSMEGRALAAEEKLKEMGVTER